MQPSTRRIRERFIYDWGTIVKAVWFVPAGDNRRARWVEFWGMGRACRASQRVTQQLLWLFEWCFLCTYSLWCLWRNSVWCCGLQLQPQGKAGKGGKGTALAIRSGPSKGKGGARKSKFGELCSMRVFHSSISFQLFRAMWIKVGTYCHHLSLSLW